MRHSTPIGRRFASPILLLASALCVAAGCLTTPVPYPEGPDQLASPAVQPAGYETAPTFAPGDVLPEGLAAGPYHRVIDPVVNDGLRNHYLIHSDFGVYETVGYEATATCVQEINAIGELRMMKKRTACRKGFQRSVKDLVLGPFRQVKRIVKNPLHLIIVIPSEITRPIGLAISLHKYASYRPAGRIVKEYVGFSGVKRRIAREFAVDPYSSNPVLQAELNAASWAYFTGQVPVRVANKFIPGLPMVSLNLVEEGESAAQAIEMATKGLKGKTMRSRMWRMDASAAEITAFLKNRQLSTGEKRSLVIALDGMEDTENRTRVIRYAVEVTSRDAARELVYQVQTMAEYHSEVEPIRRLYVCDSRLSCYTRSGVLIFAMTGDYMAWTAQVAAITESLPAACPPDVPVRRREVWLTGDATARFEAECGKLQFAIFRDSTTVLASWDAKERVALARSGNRLTTAVLVPHAGPTDAAVTVLASN